MGTLLFTRDIKKSNLLNCSWWESKQKLLAISALRVYRCPAAVDGFFSVRELFRIWINFQLSEGLAPFMAGNWIVVNFNHILCQPDGTRAPRLLHRSPSAQGPSHYQNRNPVGPQPAKAVTLSDSCPASFQSGLALCPNPSGWSPRFSLSGHTGCANSQEAGSEKRSAASFGPLFFKYVLHSYHMVLATEHFHLLLVVLALRLYVDFNVHVSFSSLIFEHE